MSNKNNLAEATNILIKNSSPGEWISFLFDLQTTFIVNGEIHSFTEEGATEFAQKLSDLKTFFYTINKIPH